jgi:hypothetical protein
MQTDAYLRILSDAVGSSALELMETSGSGVQVALLFMVVLGMRHAVDRPASDALLPMVVGRSRTVAGTAHVRLHMIGVV